MRLKAVLAISLISLSASFAFADNQRCDDLFKVEEPRAIRLWDSLSDYEKKAADPLLDLRERQKKNQEGVLKGDEETADLYLAFAENYEDFLQNRGITFDNTPSQVLRLIGYKSFMKFKMSHLRESGAKIYGVDTIRAWKEADDYLASIPVGKFKLSREVIQKVGGISGKVLKPLPFRIPGITPTEQGYFKLLPNSGREPLTEPLSEEHYQILKANKWLTGFIELPYPLSKPNARKGIILYALPHTVDRKLDALFEWYEQNKTTMDPIRLAVEFQRNFISIHPLVDGNGRASRLLMDRILLEFGLPPSLILDHNMDLYTNIDQYEKAVRQGVADSISLLKGEMRRIEAANRMEVPLSDIQTDIYKNAKWADRALAAKYKELTDYHFNVRGSIFSLRSDGFIYDQYGVPHEYYDGIFYPIADRMTELYDFGGESKSELARVQDYKSNGRGGYEMVMKTVSRSQRLMSPLKKSVFGNHLRIVEKIKEGQVNVEKLNVMPVARVAKANATAAPFFYKWQQNQFIQTFLARPESAAELLAPYYASETAYANSIRAGRPPSVALTMAQYERVDMALYDYEQAAKAMPKLRQAIRHQRSLIHSAARESVAPAIARFQALSKADQDLAMTDFRFRLFMDYYEISKLKYGSFEAAEAAGADRFVPLMRNANTLSVKFGFIPSGAIRSALRKVPYFKPFLEWATQLRTEVDKKGEGVLKERINEMKYLPWAAKKRLLAKLETHKGYLQSALSSFVNEMTLEPGTQTPYSAAGERMTWQLLKRAEGSDSGEGGLSFSTNPSLYFNGPVFANGKPENVSLNVVKAPRNAVVQNYASGFSNEYEVVGFKPIDNDAIVNQYSGVEMKARAKTTEDSLVTKMFSDLLGVVYETGSDEVVLTPPVTGAKRK